MSRPRICVTTACLNAEARLGPTVASVLTSTVARTGQAEVHYRILDGASTDGTLDVVAEVDARHRGHGVELHVDSCPDTGLFDALGRGLAALPPADAYYFLGAGDLVAPTAFAIALELFAAGVEWLSGYCTFVNERGDAVFNRLPARYRRRLIRHGLVGRALPHVQAESTFWNRRLHEAVDWQQLRGFRLAGDAWIWHQFAALAELQIVGAQLGAYCVHDDAMSNDQRGYRREVATFAERPDPVDWLLAGVDRLSLLAPVRVKKRLNPRGLWLYDHATRQYR